MKFKLELDAPNAFADLIEGITVAILKDIRLDAEKVMNAGYCHKEDKKAAKKRIKAVNELLEYYGVKDD